MTTTRMGTKVTKVKPAKKKPKIVIKHEGGTTETSDKIFQRSLLVGNLRKAEDNLVRARNVVSAIRESNGIEMWTTSIAQTRARAKADAAYKAFIAADTALAAHEVEHPDLAWMSKETL